MSAGKGYRPRWGEGGGAYSCGEERVSKKIVGQRSNGVAWGVVSVLGVKGGGGDLSKGGDE